MMYVLALIVIVVLAVLCWKAFGPGRPTSAPGPARKRVLGPDDDPEFLWRISHPRHRTDGDPESTEP
ncbi:hypothetical protein [Nocardia carnea]|uniref:hypothetical protein n=1 Tax=Nocardia carnea TaxID=37328 RepID=UPI002456915D|nr:hypothetical protein [Nocardia carnea]